MKDRIVGTDHVSRPQQLTEELRWYVPEKDVQAIQERQR